MNTTAIPKTDLPIRIQCGNCGRTYQGRRRPASGEPVIRHTSTCIYCRCRAGNYDAPSWPTGNRVPHRQANPRPGRIHVA